MTTTTTSPRLIPYPLLQKRPISHQRQVLDPRLRDGQPGVVEAQQGRHAVDHVRRAQAGGRDVRGVVLDLAERDAALDLADARFHERADGRRGERRGRPEGYEGRPRRGREEDVGVQVFGTADAVDGGFVSFYESLWLGI